MNVMIFGATGSVGRHLVEQSLRDGHTVTAFTPDPSVLRSGDSILRRRAGAVPYPAAVDAAMEGHDAAIVALGAGRKGGVGAEGTRNVVSAMGHHGVRRLVCANTSRRRAGAPSQ